MNQVTFVGRLCRDLTLKEVGAKDVVLNNVLAIQRPYKDHKGERLTDFIPFVAWNGPAKTLAHYATKGQRIAISGSMQSRKYTNDQGEQVYVIECHVRDLTLLDLPQTTKKSASSHQALDDKPSVADMQVDPDLVAEVVADLTQAVN